MPAGCLFFFFKQKTAYEIRPRDWSSDVCSSDLGEDFPFFRVTEIRNDFADGEHRSEEHTSELQSRGLISYAVFCLKKQQLSRRMHQRQSADTPALIPPQTLLD